MKKFLLFFLFCSPLFAQYKIADSVLAETAFYRSFDKGIIKNYLFSSTEDSVKAGLLSVSHSKDTAWVNEIIKLDFESYGSYIAFALGQIGQSEKSTNYLLDKIFNTGPGKSFKECFEAIGNTADTAAMILFLNKIREQNKNDLTGLPYALNNFNSRFPLPQKEEFINYLIPEIEQTNSLKRKFDALCVLYRLGGSENANGVLINILKQKDENYNPLKYYALGNLRRISYFPDNYNLFNDLIKDKDSRIRVEAARTVCFYNFINIDEIENYLSLLRDENPNVSRQAAISIGNIKLEGELKEKMYSKILGLITDYDLTDNTRGELFVNYCNYEKGNYIQLLEEFESEVDEDFIYRILSTNTSSPQKNFDYIKENITGTTEKDFLNIAQAIIPLQNSLAENAEFNKFILSILNSTSPLGIALVADNLDSLIISKNINAVQQIVLEQVFKFYNNKNYFGSLRELYELAKKISNDFGNEVLQVYKTSRVNWVKTFAKSILQEEIIPGETKDIEFNKLWELAFKYSKVKVNTNKGNFVIELTPQFAPISVGNFCYLISQNYFNNCSFHRVVPNFVIQTGDPSGTGWGDPGYEIVSEFSLQPFDESYVGMASSGKDTEGSQWFVMHSNFPHLNWRYTNFGKVVEGMEVVNRIDQKDKIISIEFITGGTD